MFAKRFSNQIVGREGDAKITELLKNTQHSLDVQKLCQLLLYHNELSAAPVTPEAAWNALGRDSIQYKE